MRPLARWFLPHDHDLLSLLATQADTVRTMLTILADWTQGRVDTATAAGSLRTHLIDERHQRRELHAAVRDTFSPPLEAEDIFEIGERLDELADAADNLVREAELSATGPDPWLGGIVSAVVSAYTVLRNATARLPNPDAAAIADHAVELLGAAEHGYREAIAALERETDLRREIRRRELYRRAEDLALAVARVARRTWYAVCKRS